MGPWNNEPPLGAPTPGAGPPNNDPPLCGPKLWANVVGPGLPAIVIPTGVEVKVNGVLRTLRLGPGASLSIPKSAGGSCVYPNNRSVLVAGEELGDCLLVVGDRNILQASSPPGASEPGPWGIVAPCHGSAAPCRMSLGVE